jgi:hypothetical protein
MHSFATGVSPRFLRYRLGVQTHVLGGLYDEGQYEQITQSDLVVLTTTSLFMV